MTTACAAPCNLGGSFTLGFNGHTTDFEAGTGIAELESALESLPTVGAVSVTTRAVHDPVGPGGDADTARARVVVTDPNIYPFADLRPYLAVGDWVSSPGRLNPPP